MEKFENLKDVLVNELKDLYSAESQLMKLLPKTIKAASNENLKDALSVHLEDTKQQIQRLEQIGKLLNEKLAGKTCKAMQGLVEEASDMLEVATSPNLLDVMIIGACQRMEHYEISVYGTIRTIAEELQLTQVVKLLQVTLDEERNVDKTLSMIADNEVLCSCMEEEPSVPMRDKKKVRVLPTKRDKNEQTRETDFNR